MEFFEFEIVCNPMPANLVAAELQQLAAGVLPVSDFWNGKPPPEAWGATVDTSQWCEVHPFRRPRGMNRWRFQIGPHQVGGSIRSPYLVAVTAARHLADCLGVDTVELLP